MSAAIDTVQVGTGYLPTVRDGDELRVVLKPAVESIGLDYSAALKRLKARSWATMAVTAMVAGDGKTRKFTSVSIDTWVMFLATVDETRVSEELRPLVIDFQQKSAKALRDHWLKGYSVADHITAEGVQQLQGEIDSLKEELELTEMEATGAYLQLEKAKSEAYETAYKYFRTSSARDTWAMNPFSGHTFELPPIPEKYQEKMAEWKKQAEEEGWEH